MVEHFELILATYSLADEHVQLVKDSFLPGPRFLLTEELPIIVFLVLFVFVYSLLRVLVHNDSILEFPLQLCVIFSCVMELLLLLLLLHDQLEGTTKGGH